VRRGSARSTKSCSSELATRVPARVLFGTFRPATEAHTQTMVTALIVVLVLLLLAAVPRAPESRIWVFGPRGDLTLSLAILLVLLLTGRFLNDQIRRRSPRAACCRRRHGRCSAAECATEPAALEAATPPAGFVRACSIYAFRRRGSHTGCGPHTGRGRAEARLKATRRSIPSPSSR
jgi:hypothetical protein